MTLFIFLFFFSSSQDISSYDLNAVTPEVKENVLTTLRKSSRKFQLISNDGQMGLPHNVIAYFSNETQMVFIEKNGLRVIVQDRINKKNEPKSFAAKKNFDLLPEKYSYNSFYIKFKGSKGFSGFEKGQPFDIQRNFIDSRSLHGSVTHVISYEEITLKNVYEGIDLRLYSQESGQLEFDWIIWPGADPDKIRMRFEGQKKLRINSAGNLEVQLAMGQFKMNMPESYYATPNGKINADYKFELAQKNEVCFRQNKKHNDQYALVIDPDLLWGTFFDGANSNFDEYLYAIEFDNSNQLLYCAGVANRQVSTAYVAALTSGYNGTFTANQDVLIYALTKNGQSISYCTYLGGSSNDIATGISISGSNIFVCGYTNSSNFPLTNGSGGTTAAFDNSFGGSKDGFVIVFNEALNQLNYSTYIGGTSNDIALTIRATSSNSFYVSLHLDGSLPASPTNYFVNYADNNFGGAEEAWIGKFSSFNTMDFGTYIGGTDIDVVNDFQL
ncbi:MAG: SBBP repeat-containing protein, partial [Bacteroidia bacterium]|nr:SBBP repeat-containing protein [Bacteroidia bacterium]